jgi:XRE family aerobic/anaerobic benzoate catabolism transcriptional regulator
MQSMETPQRSPRIAALLADLGARVRREREGRGLSQRALAEKSGLSLRFLAALESGEANISVGRLWELADALGTTAPELLGAGARRPLVVALLGVRGAGKSSVGRRLARRLRLAFVELDALVERAAGLSLGEIFAVHGEAYYRRLERAVLAELFARGDGVVTATGGSIVTDPESFAMLRERATTVWLKAEAEDHWRRVIEQGDRRPMAENPNAMAELRALLAARAPLYAQADEVVETTRLSIDEVVERIAKRLAA